MCCNALLQNCDGLAWKKEEFLFFNNAFSTSQYREILWHIASVKPPLAVATCGKIPCAKYAKQTLTYPQSGIKGLPIHYKLYKNKQIITVICNLFFTKEILAYAQ